MNEKPILNLNELNSLGRAQEINREKDGKLLREITANIKKTMRKNGLTSLSAPGIGYNKRVFCIDFSDQEIKTFINPVITNAEGLQLAKEICSSIPGKEYIRPRNTTVDIIYETPTGKIKTNRFSDVAAFVIQHEIDHLECVTLEDIGLEIEPDFEEATQDERNEIINMYLDSLDLRQKDLDTEIESDDELKVVSERLKFTEALAKGEITFDKLDELTNKN